MDLEFTESSPLNTSVCDGQLSVNIFLKHQVDGESGKFKNNKSKKWFRTSYFRKRKYNNTFDDRSNKAKKRKINSFNQNMKKKFIQSTPITQANPGKSNEEMVRLEQIFTTENKLLHASMSSINSDETNFNYAQKTSSKKTDYVASYHNFNAKPRKLKKNQLESHEVRECNLDGINSISKTSKLYDNKLKKLRKNKDYNFKKISDIDSDYSDSLMSDIKSEKNSVIDFNNSVVSVTDNDDEEIIYSADDDSNDLSSKNKFKKNTSTDNLKKIYINKTREVTNWLRTKQNPFTQISLSDMSDEDIDGNLSEKFNKRKHGKTKNKNRKYEKIRPKELNNEVNEEINLNTVSYFTEQIQNTDLNTDQLNKNDELMFKDRSKKKQKDNLKLKNKQKNDKDKIRQSGTTKKTKLQKKNHLISTSDSDSLENNDIKSEVESCSELKKYKNKNEINLIGEKDDIKTIKSSKKKLKNEEHLNLEVNFQKEDDAFLQYLALNKVKNKKRQKITNLENEHTEFIKGSKKDNIARITKTDKVKKKNRKSVEINLFKNLKKSILPDRQNRMSISENSSNEEEKKKHKKIFSKSKKKENLNIQSSLHDNDNNDVETVNDLNTLEVEKKSKITLEKLEKSYQTERLLKSNISHTLSNNNNESVALSSKIMNSNSQNSQIIEKEINLYKYNNDKLKLNTKTNTTEEMSSHSIKLDKNLKSSNSVEKVFDKNEMIQAGIMKKNVKSWSDSDDGCRVAENSQNNEISSPIKKSLEKEIQPAVVDNNSNVLPNQFESINCLTDTEKLANTNEMNNKSKSIGKRQIKYKETDLTSKSAKNSLDTSDSTDKIFDKNKAIKPSKNDNLYKQISLSDSDGNSENEIHEENTNVSGEINKKINKDQVEVIQNNINEKDYQESRISSSSSSDSDEDCRVIKNNKYKISTPDIKKSPEKEVQTAVGDDNNKVLANKLESINYLTETERSPNSNEVNNKSKNINKRKSRYKKTNLKSKLDTNLPDTSYSTYKIFDNNKAIKPSKKKNLYKQISLSDSDGNSENEVTNVSGEINKINKEQAEVKHSNTTEENNEESNSSSSSDSDEDCRVTKNKENYKTSSPDNKKYPNKEKLYIQTPDNENDSNVLANGLESINYLTETGKSSNTYKVNNQPKNINERKSKYKKTDLKSKLDKNLLNSSDTTDKVFDKNDVIKPTKNDNLYKQISLSDSDSNIENEIHEENTNVSNEINKTINKDQIKQIHITKKNYKESRTSSSSSSSSSSSDSDEDCRVTKRVISSSSSSDSDEDSLTKTKARYKISSPINKKSPKEEKHSVQPSVSDNNSNVLANQVECINNLMETEMSANTNEINNQTKSINKRKIKCKETNLKSKLDTNLLDTSDSTDKVFGKNKVIKQSKNDNLYKQISLSDSDGNSENEIDEENTNISGEINKINKEQVEAMQNNITKKNYQESNTSSSSDSDEDCRVTKSNENYKISSPDNKKSPKKENISVQTPVSENNSVWTNQFESVDNISALVDVMETENPEIFKKINENNIIITSDVVFEEFQILNKNLSDTANDISHVLNDIRNRKDQNNDTGTHTNNFRFDDFKNNTGDDDDSSSSVISNDDSVLSNIEIKEEEEEDARTDLTKKDTNEHLIHNCDITYSPKSPFRLSRSTSITSSRESVTANSNHDSLITNDTVVETDADSTFDNRKNPVKRAKCKSRKQLKQLIESGEEPSKYVNLIKTFKDLKRVSSLYSQLDVEDHKEKFNNLSIDITWDLPATHNVTRIFKNYSADEDKCLSNRWEEFCELYNFPPSHPEFFFPGKRKKREQIIKFLQFIGQDLPHRNLQSIYDRFVKLYQKHSGRFSKNELFFINEILKKNLEGNVCPPIATILGRNVRSVYSKMAYLKK